VIKQFVQGVTNHKRFRGGIDAMKVRGAEEACMLLAVGQPGYGKSVTLHHFATQEEAVFLRAKQQWTPSFFFRELAAELNEPETGRAKDVFERVCEAVARRGRPLVIDEVNHCMARGAAVLEAIRDVSDMTEVIVVLGGHEDVQRSISRYPQVRSRIAQVVKFQPATLADIRLTADTLLKGIKVADDLVTEIHRQSAGRMREIMNALKCVEVFAERNALKTVANRDMHDQRLVFDWTLKRTDAKAA